MNDFRMSVIEAEYGSCCLFKSAKAAIGASGALLD